MVKYYIDLNVIYPLVDTIAPQIIKENFRDLRKRRDPIMALILNHRANGEDVKLVISRTVYIEWFQKMIEENMRKMKDRDGISELSFSAFSKDPIYEDMKDRFDNFHNMVSLKESIFLFEWTDGLFEAPENQSWDHFHLKMRQDDYQFITFDKKFSSNKKDFILLKKSKTNQSA